MSVTLIDRLSEATDRFAALAAAAPGAVGMEVPDWLARARETGALRRPIAWRNTVVTTAGLRRLHVEFFALPGEIAVLHVCAFPHLSAALPIFGFDVIAGREKATGCFLDLSPSVPEAAFVTQAWAAQLATYRAALGEVRELPEWGTIFSSEVLAVRPRDARDFEHCLDFGAESLAALLDTRASAADPAAMRLAQLHYIDGQRRNDRTRRMLAGCIGPALADRFIDDCLFPLPATGAAAA